MIVQQDWIDAAQWASQRTGFPYASVTLAQFILETGWGQKIIAGTNPFGIKQLPGLPFILITTHEVIDGVSKEVQQYFAKFPSLPSAFIWHDNMLMRGDDYAPARKYLSSMTEFTKAMAKIYATDPNYDIDLFRLINQYDLTQYDTPIPAHGAPLT
jgi:flagellum-specific peptidoglycan hydrolase FlgJ